MKSVTRTCPSDTCQTVSRMNVDSVYFRLRTTASGCTGANNHRPWSSVPSSDANIAGESKRGKQSQSTLPRLDTRGPVERSDRRA